MRECLIARVAVAITLPISSRSAVVRCSRNRHENRRECGTAWRCQLMIFPGDGVNLKGSSALIRHSMACPEFLFALFEQSFSPAAMRICA